MARLFEYDEARKHGKRIEGGKARVSRPPTPVTPIPRRASASPASTMRVRPRYNSSSTDVQDDVTRLPTIPPSAIWQDEADVYEIEHHLAPVGVREYSPFFPSSPSIDELDTLPPTLERLHDEEPSYIDAVVEADTVMDDTLIIAPSLPEDIDMYPTRLEDALDVALTMRARELLQRKGSRERKPAFVRDPVEYMRWWLLYPNRLEFLCWLGGAMLLGIGLCIVLMMTGVGLGWMSFGHLGR